MFLRPIDLTTALRPSLLPDETLLFVQDAVGLYGGKAKLSEYQNGQAYLTSHRACYIDNEEPRKKAVAVDLKDVDRCEFYGGFIYKSSPKVSLFPKSNKLSAQQIRPSTPERPRPSPSQLNNATWICPICSFSNPVPPTFDPGIANETTPLNPCQACGIKPPLIVVSMAAIAGLSNRQPGTGLSASVTSPGATAADPMTSFRCPRCTFENHPSLLSCELCGTSLVKRSANPTLIDSPRGSSPAPYQQSSSTDSREMLDGIKFSFRGGGEKIFHERLRSALIQRKWLLQNAPPRASHDATSYTNSNEGSRTHTPTPQNAAIGIASLERRGAEARKNNEVVIGNAFEDLAALMASAKEIIALAEQLASQTRSGSGAALDEDGNPILDADGVSADPAALLSQLNLTTTKDMLGGASSSSAANLYLTELSRSIAEFLTDDSKGVLKREGGIASLVDLWAIFNRARGGVELVSPADFAAAADLFDRLKLPLRLRKFKSGLQVVQDRSRTDEKTIAALTDWLRSRHRDDSLVSSVEMLSSLARPAISWDWKRFGRGVTAQETAETFGWSVGVALEELEVAEDYGALCRETSVEGVRFWENYFLLDLPPSLPNSVTEIALPEPSSNAHYVREGPTADVTMATEDSIPISNVQ